MSDTNDDPPKLDDSSKPSHFDSTIDEVVNTNKTSPPQAEIIATQPIAQAVYVAPVLNAESSSSSPPPALEKNDHAGTPPPTLEAVAPSNEEVKMEEKSSPNPLEAMEKLEPNVQPMTFAQSSSRAPSARSTPGPVSTPATPASSSGGPVPSPKSISAQSPKTNGQPNSTPTSASSSVPIPTSTAPSTWVKPTVSITMTTLTPSTTSSANPGPTTTSSQSEKEISIVPKGGKRKTYPQKKPVSRPANALGPKPAVLSPEQNGAAPQTQYMFVGGPPNGAPAMLMPLMNFQGNIMPMFVRAAGPGNNGPPQIFQMMPNFVMQQPGVPVSGAPPQQATAQGQQQGPRLIAPANGSPSKGPKPIEPKGGQGAKPQMDSSQQGMQLPNPQNLVPVQFPAGIQIMAAPQGYPTRPLLRPNPPPQSQNQKSSSSSSQPKPIQPKLPQNATKNAPSSTQPQLQPRPIMVQTSCGQPTSQVGAAAISQQMLQAMPGMPVQVSAAHMNAMANGMPRLIMAHGPGQNSMGKGSTCGQNGQGMIVQQQGVPNLIPMHGIFPGQVMMAPPTSSSSNGINLAPTLLPSTSGDPSDPNMNMSVKEFITRKNGGGPDKKPMKLDLPKDEVGMLPPMLDASEDGALAPPILKSVMEDEENEAPPPLFAGVSRFKGGENDLDEQGGDEISKIFKKEAEMMRKRKAESGDKGPIKHFIDGFLIEEDVVPFPVEQQKIIEEFKSKAKPSKPKNAIPTKPAPIAPKPDQSMEKKRGRKPGWTKTKKDDEASKTAVQVNKVEVKAEPQSPTKETPSMPLKKKPGLKDLLKKDSKSPRSPSPSKSMKGRPPTMKSPIDEPPEKRERKKPGRKPGWTLQRSPSRDSDESYEPLEKKAKRISSPGSKGHSKHEPRSPTKKTSKEKVNKDTSEEPCTEEERRRPGAKKGMKKKPKRRELEGLLNMDFGPGKSPFPVPDVEVYKQKILDERINLRPKSEEKEKTSSTSGSRSHESSTTSLPNDYLMRRESDQTNEMPTKDIPVTPIASTSDARQPTPIGPSPSHVGLGNNTLETSPNTGQDVRLCLNCQRVLPQRSPHDGGYVQYCPKDPVTGRNCRKEFKRKAKRLAHLENSLSSSASPGHNETWRSSTGSNSNHPMFEKRWSSTGSINNQFFGQPDTQQPQCSTPPNPVRSPLPSPLVCNKSPTSMTIKLRPSPNEPDNNGSSSSSQNQYAATPTFQAPGMLPPQSRPSWSGQGAPASIQQPRTSTPAQEDMEREMEFQNLLDIGIQNWTPDNVARWANLITKSDAIGEVFIQEEIDGNALLMLNAEHFENLKKVHNLKMGPCIKLQGGLKQLKQMCGAE